MNLASIIDHTILKPDAGEEQIRQLCQEANNYHFYTVCVNPFWIPFCSGQLKDSPVQVATVCGFPLGAASSKNKIREAVEAVKNGADEVDMVINIGKMKDHDFVLIENEISSIKKEIGTKILKVIVETCYLDNEEKKEAVKIVINSGADFIKTSTGFGSGGATVEDIRLFKSLTEDRIKIKASGGIRDLETALKMIEAGADRLGTSKSVQIVSSK